MVLRDGSACVIASSVLPLVCFTSRRLYVSETGTSGTSGTDTSADPVFSKRCVSCARVGVAVFPVHYEAFPVRISGLDHGVGHFWPLSITQQRHLLAYHGLQ